MSEYTDKLKIDLFQFREKLETHKQKTQELSVTLGNLQKSIQQIKTEEGVCENHRVYKKQ